ncbi:MAG: 50S ribosomal protein L29 [Patescibacteria group bacterium]
MTKKDTMTTKTDQELIKLLTNTREILRTERFAAAGARAKNPNHLGQMRKIVARVLTEQTARTKVKK